MKNRIWAIIAAAAVALGAWYMSYVHIYRMALSHGQPVYVSVVYPVIVDMLIIAGSIILYENGPGSRLGWICVVPGVAATLYVNIESAAGQGTTSMVIASFPGAALTVSVYTVERWLKKANTPGRTPDMPVSEPYPKPLREPFTDTPPDTVETQADTPVPDVSEGVPDGVSVPSIREIMRVQRVGQDKARQIQSQVRAINGYEATA